MAETYSSEYTSLYISKPAGKVQRQHVFSRCQPFNYTQVLAGTAADTMVFAQLPPFSLLDLVASWFAGAGFTSGMTLSIGWKAYKDQDGVVQAASATGLYNASDVSNSTFVLTGGMQAQSTPDDSITEMTVRMKDFRNIEGVDLFATWGSQVPGAAATLQGMLYFSNIA
jgi:hypothetical protein